SRRSLFPVGSGFDLDVVVVLVCHRHCVMRTLPGGASCKDPFAVIARTEQCICTYEHSVSTPDVRFETLDLAQQRCGNDHHSGEAGRGVPMLSQAEHQESLESYAPA